MGGNNGNSGNDCDCIDYRYVDSYDLRGLR